MVELVLLNPHKRKSRARRASKKRHSRKHRTAAQRAATRKLVALNKRRASGGGHRRKRRKSKARKTSVASRIRSLFSKRSSSVKRRRRRRNPSGRSINLRRALSNPVAVVKPAVVGAAGALIVNGAVNYLPLPVNLKTGNMLLLTKAALALVLGTVGPKLPMVGRHAGKMAEGALTVLMTDLGKQLASQYGYNLSGTGFVNPARVMNGVGAYVTQNRGVGAYVTENRGVGGMGSTRGPFRVYANSGR